MSRFFDPLEALEAVQLVNCSALDAGRYAVESGDSFGVEGDRPRCEHWWPAPQGRGGCIPLLARDHFEDVMMLAWRHELPVCVAQAASLEAFQDFIRTKRVLFYWWSDATFAELDPQEVFLPFKALPSYGRKRVNAALQAGSRTKVDDEHVPFKFSIGSRFLPRPGYPWYGRWCHASLWRRHPTFQRLDHHLDLFS